MKEFYKAFLVICSIAIGFFLVYQSYFATKETLKPDSKAILELLEKNLEKDTQAVDEFLENIDKVFDSYISNIPTAVENKPKWKVLFAYAKFDSDQAREIIQEHFDSEIFKENANAISWQEITDRLNYELQANKNILYLEVLNSINQTPSKSAVEDILKNLRETLNKSYNDITAQTSSDILISLVSSILAEEITRLTVTASTTALLTSNGATIGTLGGPIGTGAGLATGFAVGLGVDWWLEKSNNEKMTISITQAIKSARESIKEKYRKDLYQEIKSTNIRYQKEFQKL